MTFPVQYLFGQPIGTTAGWILGAAEITFPSDANYTLTAAEAAHNGLQVVGTISTTREIIVPIAFAQQYLVQNLTTGGHPITIIGTSGTGVTVANGATVEVYCDGTNFVQAGGGSTGAPQPISIAVSTSGGVSTTSISTGQATRRMTFFIDTEYSAGATLTVTIGGTTYVNALPIDGYAAGTPIDIAPQNEAWKSAPASGVVTATVGGAPGAGAGTLITDYSSTSS